MFREIGDYFFLGETLLLFCQISRWSGDFKQARAYAEEGLRLDLEAGDKMAEQAKLWELGMLNFLEGNLQQATADFQASQARCYDLGAWNFIHF